MSKESQLIETKAKYEEKVFTTKTYGDVLVLKYLNSRNVTIKFINTGNIRTVGASELKKGEIRDNEFDPVINVGIMDVKNLVTKHYAPKEYSLWKNMLTRCYNTKTLKGNPTYQNCSVSDNFKVFSYFQDWYHKQVGCDNKGWYLDKDIISRGNKVYSETTCCFVPHEINTLITNGSSYRGKLPQGVILSSSGKRYRARVSKCGKYYDHGTYDTPEQAFEAYKVAKESHIKVVANKWKDEIDPRVYEALMSWEVCVDD